MYNISVHIHFRETIIGLNLIQKSSPKSLIQIFIFEGEKKKKKRKTLIIGVVSAFLALGLIGCGTSTESTSSQKTAASQNTEQSIFLCQ